MARAFKRDLLGRFAGSGGGGVGAALGRRRAKRKQAKVSRKIQANRENLAISENVLKSGGRNVQITRGGKTTSNFQPLLVRERKQLSSDIKVFKSNISNLEKHGSVLPPSKSKNRK